MKRPSTTESLTRNRNAVRVTAASSVLALSAAVLGSVGVDSYSPSASAAANPRIATVGAVVDCAPKDHPEVVATAYSPTQRAALFAIACFNGQGQQTEYTSSAMFFEGQENPLPDGEVTTMTFQPSPPTYSAFAAYPEGAIERINAELAGYSPPDGAAQFEIFGADSPVTTQPASINLPIEIKFK